jgi:quinol monooxygenase YgiN
MEQLTLSIKFTTTPENAAQFKQILIDLFVIINDEENFVNTTLHQGIANPGEFLVYETWNYSMEDFLKIQMKKPYVVQFEQVLNEMDIKREPAAFIPFAHFGNHVINK